MSETNALAGLVAQLERRKKIYKLEYYKPYPKQIESHNAVGKGTSLPAKQRMLCGSNQSGKTFSGAMEAAIHLTGRYPSWWKGTRYNFPIDMMIGSNTNETSRDIVQKNLLGNPLDEADLGTGTIPIDCIGKTTRKVGVANGIDSCTVRHHTNGVYDGMSKVYMRAYEQGYKKFMGIGFHVGWLDEEPPLDIWTQFLRAGLAQKDAILYITMTPEEGMTEVVTQFFNDLAVGQSLVNMTWDDALHFSEEDKVLKLAAFPVHERDMRSKGIPMMGAGLVFPQSDEMIKIEPFEIPRHWPQINGIDFGWDHPFGACSIAWDRDSDCLYVTKVYRESRALPYIHSMAVGAWGTWIPTAWPHDGLNTEKGTGEQLRSKYVEGGLNLLRDKATNPPQTGQKEGEGGNSVEASILEMYERMETGRFRVFSTCVEWFEEKRMYHRDKKAQLVKVNDDVLSASRYAMMMLRHARTVPVRPAAVKTSKGRSNW